MIANYFVVELIYYYYFVILKARLGNILFNKHYGLKANYLCQAKLLVSPPKEKI